MDSSDTMTGKAKERCESGMCIFTLIGADEPKVQCRAIIAMIISVREGDTTAG